MEKEEIIKRSQLENKRKDERDKFFESKSEIYASIIVSITIVTFVIINIIRAKDIFGLVTLLFAGIFGEFIGKIQKERNFKNIFSTIIVGIVFIYCVIRYLIGVEIIVNISI